MKPFFVRIILMLLLFSSPLFSLCADEGYSQEKNGILEDAVFENIHSYKDAILENSDVFNLDPALIVAVLYIEKMQYELDIFRKSKKRLEESLNDFDIFADNLFSWARLSIGFTHIKPSFARETKRRLDEDSRYRSFLSEEEITPSWYSTHPETAIKITAAGFYLFIKQWKDDPYGADISANPGVLATLYNIGYERSVPHGQPAVGGSTLPVIINGQLLEDLCFGHKVEILIHESEKLKRVLGL